VGTRGRASARAAPGGGCFFFASWVPKSIPAAQAYQRFHTGARGRSADGVDHVLALKVKTLGPAGGRGRALERARRGRRRAARRIRQGLDVEGVPGGRAGLRVASDWSALAPRSRAPEGEAQTAKCVREIGKPGSSKRHPREARDARGLEAARAGTRSRKAARRLRCGKKPAGLGGALGE